MKLASAAQMKELDRQAIEERGIPSIELMERAASGIAETVAGLLPRRSGKCRVAVLCGAGNNGGDGIAAARLLHLRGVRVRAFLAGNYEKLTPDALEMTRRLSECGVELEPFDPDSADQRVWVLGADVCVDALFGVGLSRDIAPGSAYAAAVDWMNESRGTVVAADIASGVAADSGRVLGRAVRADRTVTFSLAKAGQFIGDGALCSGSVEVRHIGIPADLLAGTVCPVQTTEADFVREALPARRADGHKGTFGKVLIVGGSSEGWMCNDSGKWMYYENGKAVTGKKKIDGKTYTFNNEGVVAEETKSKESASKPVSKVNTSGKLSIKNILLNLFSSRK